MPLTLYVNSSAWHEHLRAEVAREPGLIPVAKGNGYGFTIPLLARTAADLGVGQIAVGTAGDAAVALRMFPGEVISLHLPIDRPPGTDPAAQTARWVSTLTAAGYQVRTMYVSHLEATELATLATAFPDTDFRQRTGTRLWLGRRSAFRAAATVLQVLPVRRRERLGYRQYRSARDGWLVMVAGGTAHGVGLEAPGAARGLLPRAGSLARSGLAAMNRVRSPFTWDGQKQLFAEPPHMLVSTLLLPRNTEPPKPGMELGAELRHTATRFDRIALS